jgi:hypothetical protein
MAADAKHPIEQLKAVTLGTQTHTQHQRSDNHVPFHRARLLFFELGFCAHPINCPSRQRRAPWSVE